MANSGMTTRLLIVFVALSLLTLLISTLHLNPWLSVPLALLLAAGFAWACARPLERELRLAASMANKIADGELAHEITRKPRKGMGELFTALQSMVGRLDEIVGGVRVSANAAGLAARQLADGSRRLSERTQAQASALEETAASVEQLTVTVKQNAEAASQAHALGNGVALRAESSAAVVRRAIDAMDEIKQVSKQVAEIVVVIDEIAFQTNLLALNASVEAARAGEQGRGFAVVAAEVRALAQRSAASARQIKELINGSVSKMQIGAELVLDSGKSLFAITSDIEKVTGIMAEIAAASGEQATGIMQVNDAVMQLDNLTQQNAMLAAETSRASEIMEQQASSLIQQIGFFRRSTGVGAASPAQLIEEIMIHQRENARLVMNAAIARDPGVTRGAAANIRHNRDCIAALWQQYRPNVVTADEQRMADGYWALRIEFIDTIEEAIRLLADGSHDSAQQLVMTRLSEVSRPMFSQGKALKSWLEEGEPRIAEPLKAPRPTAQSGRSVTRALTG